MKKTILTFIVLIGLYALLRNNIANFPGQIMWSTHPELFYKMFIPLLMTLSAIAALIKKKNNLFLLSSGIMIVDAINRLSYAVNHLYWHLIYNNYPTPVPIEGSTVFSTNYWPSHIMLCIEVILIALILWSFLKSRVGNECISS